MPRVREPTPLGILLRARRGPLGWDRVVAATGFKERAMRTYESGGVMPPLDKALRLGEYYGIPLEELAATVLGRPYVPSGERTRVLRDRSTAARESGEALAALDAPDATGKRPRRASRPRKPRA